jgi:hypothetical protein
MDPMVEVWVLGARRRNRDRGPRRPVHEASRAGVDPVPSRSGVYRALKRAGLIAPAARRRRDRRFKRWERGGAMELWQIDVVGGVLLGDGRECKILTGIDMRGEPALGSLADYDGRVGSTGTIRTVTLDVGGELIKDEAEMRSTWPGSSAAHEHRSDRSAG